MTTTATAWTAMGELVRRGTELVGLPGSPVWRAGYRKNDWITWATESGRVLVGRVTAGHDGRLWVTRLDGWESRVPVAAARIATVGDIRHAVAIFCGR